jgi:hypothetical protein
MRDFYLQTAQMLVRVAPIVLAGDGLALKGGKRRPVAHFESRCYRKPAVTLRSLFGLKPPTPSYDFP